MNERKALFPYRIRLAWERRKLALSEWFIGRRIALAKLIRTVAADVEPVADEDVSVVDDGAESPFERMARDAQERGQGAEA